MRRSTPFPDIVTHLTPFFVSRQVICGQGRVGTRPAGRRSRFPDQPARGLLRGRGRARDHPEASDHQHPRRTPRRRREVPATARHHRRREPGRGRRPAEGRYHLSGPRNGRRRLPRQRAGRIMRPVHELHEVSHDPDLRHLVELRDGRSDDVPSTSSASTATRRTSSSRTASAPRSTTPPPRSCHGGSRCSTTSTRPEQSWPGSSTGWPSGRSSRAIDHETGSPGRTPGSSWSTCSTPTSVLTRGCTSGWRAQDGWSGSSTKRPSSKPSTSRLSTPEPGSGASASVGTAATWRPHRGTR